jgi:hypothetical protein
MVKDRGTSHDAKGVTEARGSPFHVIETPLPGSSRKEIRK